MADAQHCLITNNPYYKDVRVNQQSFPENGVPQDFISVGTQNDDSDSFTDLCPQNDEDVVYNKESEMSSFLPIPQ